MLALAALAASTAGARTLTPAEALARAAKSSQAAATGTSRGHSVLEPVMTIGADDTPAVYVFTPNESGYLIVSADDVAAPVLGYSDTGIFDPEKMSPSMRWWLEEYSAQIRAAAAENAGSYEVTAREDRDPIGLCFRPSGTRVSLTIIIVPSTSTKARNIRPTPVAWPRLWPR